MAQNTTMRAERALELYAGGMRQGDIARELDTPKDTVNKMIQRARTKGDVRAIKGDEIGGDEAYRNEGMFKGAEPRSKECDYKTCKELGIQVTYWRLSNFSDKVISLPRISILEKDLPG
jgi:transposase